MDSPNSLVVLKAEDTAQVKVPLALLSTLGPYFNKIVTKSAGSDATVQVRVMQANRDILLLLVAFIHGRPIHLEPLTVWKLVRFAKHYKSEPLLQKCSQYLRQNITPNNCIRIIQWMAPVSQAGPGLLLIKAAEEFLLNNFETVFQRSPEFPLIDKSHLHRLLSNDKLNVSSEAKVWESIARWTKFDLTNRRPILPELLKTLRYGRLDAKYIKFNIQSSSLVKGHSATEKLVQEMLDKYSCLRVGSWKDPFGRMNDSKNIACRPRVPREVIAIFGGWTSDQWPANDIEVYDPQVRMWIHHELPSLERIAYCCLEWLDGAMFIIGGTNGVDPTDKVYRLDPLTQQAIQVASMSSRRCFVATAVLNNQIYAMGGHDGEFRLDSCERYDPATNAWQPVATMNVIRSDAAAAVHRGKIYIAGGIYPQGVDNSVEVYDASIDRWTMIEPLSIPRSSLALVAYHDKLFAIGGTDGMERQKIVERYDFKQHCWTRGGSLATARSTFKAVVCNDRLYAINGYENDTLNTVEVYHEESDSWRAQLQQTRHNRSGFGACIVRDLANMEQYTYNGMKTT